MSAARPNRGRGRPTRSSLISQDGITSDGPSLLYSLTHPPLYPELLWHSSGRASFAEGDLSSAIKPDTSSSDPTATGSSGLSVPLQNLKRSSIITYILHKQDEIQRALHQQQTLLYSTHKSKRQKILSDILGDTRHFPAELLFEGHQRNGNEKRQHRSNNSVPIHHTDAAPEHLEQQDEDEPIIADVVSSAATPINTSTEDEHVEAEEDEYADDPEVEEVEEELDYTQDYYASDPDSDDDGGDGEAVF